MQRGYNNQILIEDGKFIGVCLGSDYCSEHEWGIKELLDNFNVDEPDSSFTSKITGFFGKNNTKYGLEKRKITYCPKNLQWISTNSLFKNDCRIWFGIYYSEYATTPPISMYGCYPNDKDTLITLWDNKGFCILSCDPNNLDYLLELKSAFKDNNIVFTFQSMFLSVGLTICIADRIPEDVKKQWYDFDLEQEKLKKAFEDSGIKEKLKHANKNYFACFPKSFDENDQLRIWLNPYDQKKYNTGYVSIKDLEDWIKDKGSIVKTNKE